MFLLLPESTLYDTNDVACHDDVFRFVVKTECLLFNVMESI